MAQSRKEDRRGDRGVGVRFRGHDSLPGRADGTTGTTHTYTDTPRNRLLLSIVTVQLHRAGH